jgi:signal-transduction protein with cAMP-binding, CBS, and nucleotidyltransferase domain
MSDPVAASKLVTLPRFPCTVAQRSQLIGQTEWSDQLSWVQTGTFARYVDAFEARKGVEIVKEDSAGGKKTLATIGPGKTFGEMSLIDGEPRSATALALDDSKVVILTEENFHRLTYRHPRLGVALLLKLATLMSQRLRRTSIMLVDFLEG